MAQLFSYLVCTRAAIDQWAATFEHRYEELHRKLESEMPRFITLKDLGHDAFNILAQCAQGGDVDAANTVGKVDLIKAIDEQVGPWVLALRQSAIEVIARMHVDSSLIQRWVKAVAGFQGRKVEDCGQFLTADAARAWQEACALAVKERLGVFTCFYG